MGSGARSPEQVRKVIRILVIVYSCCLFAATTGTVVSLFFVNDLLANSTHVDGEVVDLERGAKGAVAPVVRFKTLNGEVLQLKSNVATSPGPKVGETIKVLYRTNNPQDWQIDDWLHVYFWTFMGSIFMFAWTMALTVTAIIGKYQTRKLS